MFLFSDSCKQQQQQQASHAGGSGVPNQQQQAAAAAAAQSWSQVMSPSSLTMPNINNYESMYSHSPKTPQTPQGGPPSVASSHGGHLGSYDGSNQGPNPTFPPSSTPDILNSLSQMNVVSPQSVTDINGAPVPSPLAGLSHMGGPVSSPHPHMGGPVPSPHPHMGGPVPSPHPHMGGPVLSPHAHMGVPVASPLPGHPHSVEAPLRHPTPGTPQCPPSVGAANPLTPQSVGMQQQLSCPGTPGSIAPSSTTPQSTQQANSNSISSVALTNNTNSLIDSSSNNELGLPELSFDPASIIDGTGPQDLDVSTVNNACFTRDLHVFYTCSTPREQY